MKTLAHHLIQILLMMILISSALWLYDQRIARPRLRIGLVDVAKIYRQKEAEFAHLLLQGRNDAERDRAIQMARRFAAELPQALEDLSNECHCLVVLRSSVAGMPPNAFDMTPLLRQKVSRP